MKLKHIASQYLLLTSIICLLIITALGLIITFIFKFANGTFSSNIEDWSNSADFVNLPIGLLSLSVLIVFSFLAYYYSKAIEEPTLGFKTILIDNIETWQVSNFGKGTALNIAVTYIDGKKTDWENQLVLCYHLSQGEKQNLYWLKNRNPGMIAVFYTDIHNSKYLSVVSQDTTHLIPINEHGKPRKLVHLEYPNNNSEKVEKIFNKDEIIKITNLKTVRLHSLTNSTTTTTENTPRPESL